MLLEKNSNGIFPVGESLPLMIFAKNSKHSRQSENNTIDAEEEVNKSADSENDLKSIVSWNLVSNRKIGIKMSLKLIKFSTK